MEFALLRCCVTTASLKQYESATDAVLEKLGVELIDIKEFNCCGYPLKNINFKAHALLSARNLALAEKRGSNITTLCNCCYGSEKHINHLLKTDAFFRKEINTTLEKEGLQYNGDIEVKHLLEIFYEDIGIAHIKEQVTQPFSGLKIATHYGCHLVRPDQVVGLENPGAASIFDRLVEVTGAESIAWPKQLECCGAPVWGINDDLSMDLTQGKILDAQESDADYLCVSCPFCQLQFDRVQNTFLSKRNDGPGLPSILYTQLLGLCMGVDGERLGVQYNEMAVNEILDFSTVDDSN
jgi:heterodisulfide reductase subunit B